MEKDSKAIKVLFFQISKNREKIDLILNICCNLFENRSPLIILLQNENHLNYLDDLLWKYPKDGFLPHAIQNNGYDDYIVLTTREPNLSKFNFILNLKTTPISNKDLAFKKIYEFEDSSSVDKKRSSQMKYKHYKNKGYNIILVNR